MFKFEKSLKMKAQIVHNPTAGKDEHRQEEVEKFVQQGHFSKVKYVSTEEEGWEDFDKNKSDLIFLAGGDGTVHKLATVLLHSKYQDPRTPIHILPLGTANNIAKTLDVVSPYKLHAFDSSKQLQKFDVGRVKGLPGQDSFLEGVGAGLFPALIAEMKENPVEVGTANEELHYTLKRLLKIVKDFKAQQATIKTSGISITGRFLLLEVMNIQYIGPNFELASKADPGDGYFDLVLIPDEKREELMEYLEKMLLRQAGEDDLKDLVFSMRIRHAEIKWEDSHVHVDDDLIPEFTGGSFVVSVDRDRLRFVRNP